MCQPESRGRKGRRPAQAVNQRGLPRTQALWSVRSSTDSGGLPTAGGPPALLSPPIHLSVSARDTHVWSNGPAEMTHKITIAVRVATLRSSGRRQRDGPHLLATAMVLL